MPDSHHRVTIKEVAAQAGVSVATISRVLNGKGPVRETTSRRVMETCQALRFTPHGIARSLSLRRTHTIGLLFPICTANFFRRSFGGLIPRRGGAAITCSFPDFTATGRRWSPCFARFAGESMAW